MVEIGDKVTDSITFKKGSFIMISPAQLEVGYTTVIEGIKFTICKDKNNLVKYIETKDNVFITEDSIKIGMSLTEVKKLTNNELRLERGWAFVMPLPSGWNVAFEFSKDDFNKISPDSTIKWIFKRK